MAAKVSIPANANTYKANVSGQKVQGGTVTWTGQPSYAPNYIFPYPSAQVCSTANSEYLQWLMYRPLYWYGNNNKPTIDYDYSIGQAPQWSNGNKTVTIKLNNWKWSDGEQVSSSDVAFGINIAQDKPADNDCYYVPPGPTGEKFFPDNVASMSTPDPSTIVLNLTQSYNPTWFLYNELSQITPIPLAWDKTSPSAPTPTTYQIQPAGSPQTDAVYKFLDAQSKNVTSWATNPMWGIVDGPWKLTAFDPSAGNLTFVPNPTYSGSPKPTIDKFQELGFTDDNAITNALKTKGPNGLTVGQLPPQNAGQLNSIAGEGYKSQTAFTYSTAYFPLNLNNPQIGPAFKQQYVRQAIQHLVNQQGWTSSYLNNWAYPQVGPVPTEPPNSFASQLAKSGPLSFDVNTAKKLLSDHGWNVVPNGTTTCAKPGNGPNQCGPGVKAGTPLAFNLDYATGITSLQQELQNLQSVAKKAGIKIDLTQHEFKSVVGTATQCAPTDAKCNWTAEDWGAGWIYAPDYYPSGESLFQTGASANFENYSDPKADQLIAATTTASPDQSQAALNAYQDYIIQQNPVIWIPNAAGNPAPNGVQMIDGKLGGVQPNAYAGITPEAWYFTK